MDPVLPTLPTFEKNLEIQIYLYKTLYLFFFFFKWDQLILLQILSGQFWPMYLQLLMTSVLKNADQILASLPLACVILSMSLNLSVPSFHDYQY